MYAGVAALLQAIAFAMWRSSLFAVLALAVFTAALAADVTISSDGSSTQDDAAQELAALKAENLALRERVSLLEQDKIGLQKLYADFKEKYAKGCPYCPPERPPETIQPGAAPNNKLRDEIDQLLSAERERQVTPCVSCS